MPGLFDGTPLERPVTCEHCGLELSECNCPRGESGDVCLPCHQRPRVRREKRRGKWCAVVVDLDPTATDLKALLRTLRTKLGTGGGISDNELVIQGDHQAKIVAKLCELGYQAKPSGG